MDQVGVMGKLSIFNRRKFDVKPRLFETATLSDFSGGLNLADNDLTMKSHYAKILRNFNKNMDGSESLRWGTRMMYDVSSVVSGIIVELVYFNSHLIAFMSSGEVAKITEAGVVTAIWNTAIAALLPGAPTAWTTVARGGIDTSEFKGELIAVNGTDKPIIISKTLTVTYLQDLATGSNVNTPIAKYVTTVSNFLVMAGISASPADIYISSQGTSGVWPGDAAPNDSLTINIGAWIPENSGDVVGLGSFRNNLIVAFNGAIVVVELGQYEGTTHTPRVQDNIVQHGFISHRTTITTKNDFVMADVLGWHSAFRTQFGLVDTKGLSELINVEFQPRVPLEATRSRAFSVYNKLENRFMTIMPATSESVYVYTMSSSDRETIKKPAFSEYIGWNWDCGCASARGRVYFAKNERIYLYGNEVFDNEDFTADFINDWQELWTTAQLYIVGRRVFQDDTTYVCKIEHTSGVFADDLADGLWEEYLGEEIEFEFELPWVDINARARKKFLNAIQADTRGKAAFTIDVYVDNFYRDPETGELLPAVTMDFVAGDSLGYGGGDQPFGGGRRLKDERPWRMPVEFKIMKLRIHGSSKYALQIITLTILYYMGTYRR